jgi:Fe2+ transport system protein FeoA
MQLSVNKAVSAAPRIQRPTEVDAPCCKLADLREGEVATIERLDLPVDLAHRLMELGFLPGMKVTAGGCAPGGDPRVYQIDGSEVALRRETAAQLLVKL